MRLRSLLFNYDNEPRLVVPGLCVIIATFVVALALLTALNRPRTPEQKAESLMHSGKAVQAEKLYLELLQKEPTVERAMDFLNAHAVATSFSRIQSAKDKKNPERSDQIAKSLGAKDDEPISEEEVAHIVATLPPDVSAIAQYGLAVQNGGMMIPPEIVQTIEAGAERAPPMPYANELLGERALGDEKPDLAALYFEKEGINFPERRADIDRALHLRMRMDDWDTVRERLANPRYAAAAGPEPKYELAVHDRDWQSAVTYLPQMWRPRFQLNGFIMSAMTALGWFFFCARLGKAGQRPKFRIPMYLLAFVLGVCSVAPTVVLIAIEEAKLHLVETGNAGRDVLFFVFGVGLREEASKLLMFLPLLPLLRRYGDKLDVLVCGAMVGLGFAAEENLGYLAQDNLTTGLARFLTANFFHMAMTGTLASALDDFVSDREKYAADFSRISVFIVGIHGAYDFLISHDEYGGGYLSMVAFVFLTRFFLDAVDVARRRADRGITPLHAFIFAVALVTGVSMAFACMAVGPKGAFMIAGGGLLGQAIIVYVFVRQLHRM